MTEGAADAVQRTLLLTDVVDSTQLLGLWGDTVMAAAWAAHDRTARDLLACWNGREIDKSDGMLLLFERASDAAGFALEYHRALALLSPPLLARVGLHAGPVILRRNAAPDVARGAKPLEVEGLAKAVAARVMGIAQGGSPCAPRPSASRSATRPGRCLRTRTGIGVSRESPNRSSSSA